MSEVMISTEFLHKERSLCNCRVYEGIEGRRLWNSYELIIRTVQNGFWTVYGSGRTVHFVNSFILDGLGVWTKRSDHREHWISSEFALVMLWMKARPENHCWGMLRLSSIPCAPRVWPLTYHGAFGLETVQWRISLLKMRLVLEDHEAACKETYRKHPPFRNVEATRAESGHEAPVNVQCPLMNDSCECHGSISLVKSLDPDWRYSQAVNESGTSSHNKHVEIEPFRRKYTDDVLSTRYSLLSWC